MSPEETARRLARRKQTVTAPAPRALLKTSCAAGSTSKIPAGRAAIERGPRAATIQPSGSRFAHFAGQPFLTTQAIAARAAGTTFHQPSQADNKFAGLAPCYGLAGALRALSAYTQAPRSKAEIQAEKAEARELAASAVATARRLGVIR